MIKRFKAQAGAFASGLHFRFLSLLVAVACIMLAVQLVSDTISELSKQRDQRINEAMGVTNAIARSLEKQFDYFELDDIEQILASVRKRKDVLQLTVVDKNKSFFLDGDLQTSPIAAVDHSAVQLEALETGKTSHRLIGDRIEVAEPLLTTTRPGAADFGIAQQAIGSVMIVFHNPTLLETLGPIVKSKLYSAIPILIFGLLFAAKLASQITLPILELSKTAETIANGDFDIEVEPKGANEIQQLSRAFNLMVSTVRKNIAQIYDLAYVDKITRLPNREFFRRELSRAVSRVVRHGKSGALLFVDLDGFKRINDTFGHDCGDTLLAQFADRIGAIVRDGDAISFDAAKDAGKSRDVALASGLEEGEENQKRSTTFARLGGDEFTILLPDVREETDAGIVARRIIDAVSQPFLIQGKEILVGASIGIASFPRDGADYQTILKHADMAMYQAKDEGKNTFRFFSSELNEQASQRMEIETDLRKALAHDELELYYQPKINVKDNSIQGMEALIRWNHPQKGMINPGAFIQIAEDCGLILPLGEYVIRTACKQIAAFSKQGRDIPIAVNISVHQFQKPDFAETVFAILKKTGANPKLLELEITESMAMSDPEVAIKHMSVLKSSGVRFAIDDFGTGYSNLAQLSRLPFDVFKIDRSFVKTIGNDDPASAVIIRTIFAMAKSLNFKTVAEGVETQDQAEALRAFDCDVFQGFLFAKPMNLGALNDWIDNRSMVQRRAA